MKTLQARRGVTFLAIAVWLGLAGNAALAQFDVGDLLKRGEQTVKGLDKLGKAAGDIDPSTEYYIGRSAAANVLAKYPTYDDEQANRYVNQVGHALAAFSRAPEVYSGYHFQLLDSDEVNAFAAPGAFIFVTRGMLRLCQNEDELAAVLAHEIGHVQNRHAVEHIKSSRRGDFGAFVGKVALEEAGPAEIQLAGDALAKGVDATKDLLFVKGYGQSAEKRADEDAVRMLRATGYNPWAMLRVLERMNERSKKEKGLGIFRTHPKTDDRIKVVRKELKGVSDSQVPAVRVERFESALRQARAE